MRITANQVTAARILLMPPLVWFLYGDATQRVIAVIVGTVVGCTDFVDGYLARKHGPTVLGGLMDPVADKVFIAVAFLPAADLGLVPWWPIALLFLREFVVTAMRSSFELRQRALRSTYLAKVKTWVQMIGVGMLFLMLVDAPRYSFLLIFGIGAAGALVGGIILTFVLKKKWKGAWVFFGCFAASFAVFALTTTEQFEWVLLATVVGITWLSGVDYVIAFFKQLLAKGDFKAFDAVRFLGATGMPLLALLALVRTDAATWPLIILVSLELAHGGLDNLLAHHGAASPWWSWGARLGAECALLGAALAIPEHATAFCIAAFAIAAAGTIYVFAKNRRFYLEEKLREKKLSPSPSLIPDP
jgi:CDP-diacylglycerol--glycerol-3-phosphate 3-phosphatidyltransferase